MTTQSNSAYSVNCDPVTGICTAKLKIPAAGRAYEIPAERRGKLVEDRLKSAGSGGVDAGYLGYGLNIVERQIDEAKRTILFVCSTAAVDRYGDIIKQEGWQIENYLRNPVVLWGHDSRSLPIGRSQKTAIDKGRLVALIEFATADVYAFADTVFKMVAAGFVNTLSVGFMPIEWEWRRGEPDEDNGGYQPIIGRIYNKSELLENSVVSVPANPEALVVGREFEAAFRAIELDEAEADFSEVNDREAKEFANRKNAPASSFLFSEPCERAYFSILRKAVRRHGSLNPVDSKDVDAEPYVFIWGESFQTISLSTEERAEAEAFDITESDSQIKEAFLGELVGADIDGRAVYCATIRIERGAAASLGFGAAEEVRAGGKRTQTVIFSKKNWTLARAKRWCVAHGLKTSDPQSTDSSYRFRQFPPSECKDGTYETLTENMPKGLSLVVCNKKSSKDFDANNKGVGTDAQRMSDCNCKPKNGAAELKAVVPYHAYPLAPSDAPWNAPKEMASTDKASDWKKMSTIILNGGKNKGDFKLPHHKGPGGGFKTVRRGVANALARAGQVKGASAADKAGAKAHLAKHMKQFHADAGKAFEEVVFLADFAKLEAVRDSFECPTVAERATKALADFAYEPKEHRDLLEMARVVSRIADEAARRIVLDQFVASLPESEQKMKKGEAKRRLAKIQKHVHGAHEEMKAMGEECSANLSIACDMADAACEVMAKAFETEELRDGSENDDPASGELGDETVGDKIRSIHKSMKEARSDAIRGMQAYGGHVRRALHHLKAVCNAMDEDENGDPDNDPDNDPNNDEADWGDSGFPPSTDDPEDDPNEEAGKTDDPSDPDDDPEATNGPGKSLEQLLNEAQASVVNGGAAPPVVKDDKKAEPSRSTENELEILMRAVSETQE